MEKFLNNFQMKFVRIIRALVVIYSIGMLGCGIYILAKTKSSFEPALLFPIIFGICWLLNVCRFNRELKANKNKITLFRTKCYLLMLARVVFFTLAYFSIMQRNAKHNILFMFDYFNYSHPNVALSH